MVQLGVAPVLRLRGGDVVDLLQRVSTNDMLPLSDKQDVCTIFTTEKGRIAEFAHVVPLHEHGSYIAFLAGVFDGDFREWIQKYIILEDVEIDPSPISRSHWIIFNDDFTRTNAAAEIPGILLQNRFLAVDESFMGRHWTRVVDLDGADRSAHLLEEMTHVNLVAFEVFDSARIHAGIPFAGKELSESFNPMEARAREYVSFTKGCYVGQEVIARLDSYKKVSKVLSRMKGSGEALPGPLIAGEKDAGALTSVVQIDRSSWAGLGYVRISALGSEDLTLASTGKRVTILDQEPASAVYGG